MYACFKKASGSDTCVQITQDPELFAKGFLIVAAKLGGNENIRLVVDPHDRGKIHLSHLSLSEAKTELIYLLEGKELIQLKETFGNSSRISSMIERRTSEKDNGPARYFIGGRQIYSHQLDKIIGGKFSKPPSLIIKDVEQLARQYFRQIS